jgi:hypothetical protein
VGALVAACGGCGGGPRVSPWGEAGRPRLADYAVQPDLEGHLAAIEAEAARLGLVEVHRTEGRDPRTGDPLVAIALRGEDGVGRAVHAVRVASPWGVVLARGPLDVRDVRRREAAELLFAPEPPAPDAVGAPLAPAPLADRFADGTASVLLRDEQGRVEVWRVTGRASLEVPVVLAVPPTEASDVDGDGRLDLAGRAPAFEPDPIGPDLRDVATWSGAALTDRTEAARGWHAARRDRARASRARARSEATRLRATLEAAWHAILAGADRARELEALDRERPSAPLRAAWREHVRRIGGADR